MRFKKYVYDQVQYQQMQHYQPYDRSWNASHQILHDKWINCSTNVFQKMKCIALCRIIQLNTQIFNKKIMFTVDSIFMKLDVHLMALLIVFCQIIQLQMENTCFYV
jgi:hypothetical protein